jgi:hypothetical protein
MFKSYLHTVLLAQESIAEAALEAASAVVEERAKMNAQGGFKTGQFATNGWRTIGRQVIGSGSNARAIIGSTEKHFQYWEVGHQNVFTRRYERNRWLHRAVMETQPQQAAAAGLAARAAAAQFGLRGRIAGAMFDRSSVIGRVGRAY